MTRSMFADRGDGGDARARPPDPRTMQIQCSFYEILTQIYEIILVNQNVM